MKEIRSILLVFVLLFCGLVAHAQLPGIPIPGVGIPGGGVPVPDNLLYEYPNPYANKAVSYRSVYLYKKAELDAAFTGNKIFYGLAFSVKNQQGALLRNMSISLAEVDIEEVDLNNIEQNFTQVYFREGYTEVNGINTHAFDIPFCFSGDKNLLVKICVQNFTDERSYNAGVNTMFPDSVTNYSFHDWSNLSENLCNRSTDNAEVYLKRPVTYFYANPIDKTDFRTINAANPSGIEFINSVHQPEITIKNFSCDVWDDYEIGYQIEGGPVQTERPGVAMIQGEVKTFQFGSQLNLDEPGFFELKYWVSHPNESVPQNDTLTRLVWVRENKFEGLDYTGTDFWIGFMQNFSNPATLKHQVFVTGLDTGEVTVALPALGWSTTFSILPLQVVTVDVPVNYAGYVIATDEVGLVQPTGINVTSTAEIAVYGLSQSPQSSDGFLAIPTPSLGREYFTVSPIGTYFPVQVPDLVEDELPAEILLVGTEDGTQVDVILSNPANGKEKGDTIVANLNKGETFLLKARTDRLLGAPTGSYDLTGTQIVSNNKLVVFGGSQCATVPGIDQLGSCQYCDHIMEELTPTTTWGNSYYLTDYAHKPGEDIIRIVGGNHANTTVNVNGTIYFLNGPGDYVDHRFVGNVRILATNPVQVVQMCTGGQCFPISSTDPFFINALPDVQWGGIYNFTTVVSDYFPFHFINIIKRAGIGRVALDGTLLGNNLFSQVPGTDYYAAKLQVTEGTHIVTSDTTISVSVYGFGRDDGYGFPASGARLQPVNVDPPILTGTTEDVSCYKYTDGKVLVEGSEGTPPYQFIWQDGFIGDTRDSVPSGEYIVTLIDDYGFSVTDTFYVLEADSFYVNFTTDSVTCFGDADGNITAEVLGGAKPYQQLYWNNAVTDTFLYNYPSGTYTLNVEDANGCWIQDSTEIISPEPLSFNAHVIDVLCYGEANGEVSLQPKGGTPGYVVQVRDQANNQMASNSLSVGVYTLLLEDSKQCLADSTIEVFQPKPVNMSFSTVPSGCLDAATGKIFLTPSGGVGNFRYGMGTNEAQPDSVFDELVSGDYTVWVQDSNACTFSNLAKVSTVPVPDFTVTTTPDFCGEGVGTGNVSISGGTSPFSAFWILDGDTINGLQVNNIKYGTYTVVAQDKHCKETFIEEIEPTNRPDFNVEVSPATCGLNNGRLKLDVISYRDNYGAKLASGSVFINDEIDNLGAGSYEVIFTDGSCEVHEEVEIPAIPEMELDSTWIVPAHCELNNGKITAFVSGGSGEILYSWNQFSSDSNSIENLDEGTYTLNVSDDFCNKSFEIDVTRLSLPQVTFQERNPNCQLQDGNIAAYFSGGSGNYAFEWLHSGESNATAIQNLDSGFYALRFNDGYCEVVDSIHLEREETFTISDSIVATHCDLNDGLIKIATNVPGNYSYSWDGYPNETSNTLQGLGNEDVKVTVILDGCIVEGNYHIPVAPLPVFNGQSTPATCELNNGRIEFLPESATGFTSFQDSINQTIVPPLTNLAPGSYQIKIFDGFCYRDTVMQVLAPALPSLTAQIGNEGCEMGNGSINAQLFGNDPVSILWADNFSTDTFRYYLNSGFYPYTIQDRYCTVKDSVFVDNDPASPTIVLDSLKMASCGLHNAILNVTVTGPESPYTISWNDVSLGNNTQLSNLAPGTYTLTVEGAICKEEVTYSVGAFPPLTANAKVVKNVDCGVNSGQVAFEITNALGEVTLKFNGITQNRLDTLFDLAVGTYSYQISDSLCTVSGSINVPLGLDLSYSISSQNENCEQADGSIEVQNLVFASHYQATWSDGGNGLLRNNLVANSYDVTIQDSLCVKTSTITLINNEAPHGALEIVQSDACEQKDGIARFTNLSFTDNFIWFNGIQNQTQISNLASGEIWVNASNAFCNRVYKAVLPATSKPVLSATSTPDYCDLGNGRVILNPNVDASHLPFSYINNLDGNSFSENEITGLISGPYDVIVTDARGCSDRVTGEVNREFVAMPGGEIFFQPNTPSIGSNLMLMADLPPFWSQVHWRINGVENSSESPVFQLKNDTSDITLITTHFGGCLDSLHKTIIVKPDVRFYIPNTFTPDGDGINEYFAPVTSDVLSWKGHIFNRWGEMIHEFTDKDSPWDGTYQGEPAKIGVYPVVFYFVTEKGLTDKIEGRVILLR